MSFMNGLGSGSRTETSQDFELNIASIIDCFTVLIAFMLASTAFLAIGILDAGVAAAGAQSTNVIPPPVNIVVDIGPNNGLTIKVSGKVTQSIPVPPKGGEYDYAAMTTQLEGLKTRWAGVQAVTVSAENRIEYKDVVLTMDTARKTLPVVLLGGF